MWTLVGRTAVIGLSRSRHNQTLQRLALEADLTADDTGPYSGLLLVDIDTRRHVEWLRFDHTIYERHDVAVLKGIRQPEAIGFCGDEIKQAVQFEASALTKRASQVRQPEPAPRPGT